MHVISKDFQICFEMVYTDVKAMINDHEYPVSYLEAGGGGVGEL